MLCDIFKRYFFFVREKGDLCFALITDTHISDEGVQTRENIKAVDSEIGFDFTAHLGNLINGDNPEKISRQILRDEIQRYQDAISAKKLFVSRGDTDGWRNERFLGQLVKGIMTDEAWYEDTNYLSAFKDVVRQKNKPYYYVDFKDYNIRLVFLCSYHYQYDADIEFHQKYTGIDAAQAKWLVTEALFGCEGMEVLMFSHRIPQSRFETGKDPFFYKGNSTESVCAIIQRAMRRGVNIACWFGGAYGYDSEITVEGINFAVIDSQMPRATRNKEHEHKLDLLESDAWDAAVLKKNQRRLYIFRFGRGNDRVIQY